MSVGNVAELFAGVGGFRLALEGHPALGLAPTGWNVVWSDQFEPSTRKQHASDCYVRRFGPEGHVNEDIAKVLDDVEAGRRTLPPIDLVVGGSPCQDFSVARILSQAKGIQGKKGVLWWQIERFLRIARPRYLFLENVDRMLRSPAAQRGRDFGVMLGCLAALGYVAEWRVVNAADYGFPQRRRRTFVIARHVDAAAFGSPSARPFDSPGEFLVRDGVLARALSAHAEGGITTARLPADLVRLSDEFAFEFENAGVMHARDVWTMKVAADYEGARKTLADVLLDDDRVPRDYVVPRAQLKQWRYLKGAKSEPRSAKSGYEYAYTEGALPFPDPLERPSRTILTGEGGSTPSRFKHVVQQGRHYRRLTPLELERLNGFPDDWTDTGMPEGRRAFCMGNALVVGLVHRIACELAADASLRAAA